MLNLGGLAVDWRYVIPFDSADATKYGVTTHPMLYVAGVGGVFRSTNAGTAGGAGTNWTVFPDQTLATPVANGNLPAATISDLDMVLGNVDPTTGHPDVSTGPNLLLATTYGSGSYGIRLAPIIFNDSSNSVTETQNNAGVLTFKGLSEQSAFGTAVAVTVEDVTNPNDPIYLGGYNPLDGSPSISPTFANLANQTDVNGLFSVSGNYPAAPAGNPFLYDGTRTVEVFATDASGTKGNVVSFQITNNLPTPTAGPVFVNANDSLPPLTGAVISGGTITTTSAPTFQFTVPNPGVGNPIAVTLIRIDGQGNTVPVNTVNLTGTAVGTTLTGYIQDTTNPPVGTYTYEFQYTVTIDGQPTNSPVSPTTTVKVVAPMAAPTLFYQDDSGIASIPSTLSDGITNVQRPRFVGTAIPNAANDPNLTLELIETAYTSTVGGTPVPLANPVVLNNTGPAYVDPVNGQYTLQPSMALADGTYTIAVKVTDAGGDTITSTSPPPPPVATLTIDTKAPSSISGLALLTSSHVPNDPNTPNATVVRRPTVTGMTDPGAIVTIKGSVNGGPQIVLATATAQPYNNGGHPAGYFAAQLPSNLTDGTVKLYAYAENAAGNTNPTPSTLALKIFSVPGDYTGVGAAGLAVYTPATGNYDFAHAGTGITTFLYGFGLPNVDIPVPDDYNGDGQTDPATYRPTNGWWTIDVNSQVAGQQYLLYVPPIVSVTAYPGTIPTPADYDTDGQADPAVFSIVYVNGVGYGVFTILHNEVTAASTATVQSIAWGLAGDTPVPGDYDGAGSAEVAVYRPTTGAWYIRSSGTVVGEPAAGKSEPAVIVTPFKAGDVPDQADYDGIGRLEEAIFRPSTETFYIYNPITKATRSVVMPKLAGQGPGDVIIPASADYTGDGKADATIFDQTLGMYEYINSTTGQVVTSPFHASNGDIPPGAPVQYRVAAYAAGATASAQKGSGFLAIAPGASSATPSLATAPTSSGATPAVILGATVPTGLTSTGKTSTLPPAPAPSPTPAVALITVANSITRPAQGDVTDEAIASMIG